VRASFYRPKSIEFDYKLGSCTPWSSYILPNASSSRYCMRLPGCFAPLGSSLTALPIQRPSVFARDHAFEKHFQEVSSPLARMVRCLMPVQLSPLSYSLRYCSTSTLFTPVMNSSVRPVGLFLAYPIYGPTYAANSPYIRNTYRSNPQFLWMCVGIWLVRAQILYKQFIKVNPCF
jgi:hypothetical protein